MSGWLSFIRCRKAVGGGKHQSLPLLWLISLAVCAAIWAAAAILINREPEILLRGEINGNDCRIYVNRTLCFETELSAEEAATRQIGLYAFNPWEQVVSRQRFLQMKVREGGFHRRIDSKEKAAWIQHAGDQWELIRGNELQFAAQAGVRGELWQPQAVNAVDYVLDVRMADVFDAGIILAGDGQASGIVCTVRPWRNDVLLFRLRAGEPGPVEQIAPLKKLYFGRELLRLTGRICRNVILALFAAAAAAGLLLVNGVKTDLPPLFDESHLSQLIHLFRKWLYQWTKGLPGRRLRIQRPISVQWRFLSEVL